MFLKIFYIILILAVIAKGVEIGSRTKPVKTSSGSVVGTYRKTVVRKIPYRCYLGIPYAEPPLGELRFKPPVPKKPWTGEFHAFNDAPMCIQRNRDTGAIEGSEDCLILNVYVTEFRGNTRLRPVMVWIHGGAFTTGNARSDFYGPDFLLEQDIVLVSLQYRLGVLGFMNINHPKAHGNQGLKDQNLGLRWVKENIENFGGDPNRITVFGQSAGGVSVDLQKISPMSAGLFQQTISMSASPMCLYWAFETNNEAEKHAQLLGKILGCKSNDKDELLDLLIKTPAKTLVDTCKDLPSPIPFRPTVERVPDEPKFLTECTPKLYKEGKYNKGPHMMGFTKNEILFLAHSLDDIQHYALIAPKLISEHIPLNAIPFATTILSYPAKGFSNLTKLGLEELVDHLSELYFEAAIDKKQQFLSVNNEAPVYYYRYSFNSPHNAHKADGIVHLEGVAHEDELVHLFYRPHLRIPIYEPKISRLRERLLRLWTNFAKKGDPTHYGEADPLLGVTWPDSRPEGLHLEINDELKVESRPTNLRTRFYQMVGIADSSTFNDCPNVANNVISKIMNFEKYVSNVI